MEIRQTANVHLLILRKKYEKLSLRVQKSLKDGRFIQFSIAKKMQVYQCLARYESQLKKWGFAAAISMALLLPCHTALAQDAIPLGNEFKVNTHTNGRQNLPSIASDSDGDFVITWQSGGQDGNSWGIFAQQYDKEGIAQGNEFQVNTYTLAQQGSPAVAMDSTGNFVVTWQSLDQDGSGYGIYAQRYDAAGAAIGNEFQVNSFAEGNQNNPAIALDKDGDFIIVWSSKGQDGSGDGIYAQRYNAAGETVGNEFRINTYTSSEQSLPAVAADDDGDFVVTWQSKVQDGSSYGIYARLYNNAGISQSGEISVNIFTRSQQSFPTVAADSDGDFVITWQTNGQDGDGFSVFARRFNYDGNPQGGEFQVNTFTEKNQISPVIGADNAGDFVISWQSIDQDGNLQGIYAQRYNSAGLSQGEEFLVNTYTLNIQANPTLAVDDEGDYIIAWNSNEQDGSNNGVYAQRYSGPITCTWYADNDGDGYGSGDPVVDCTQPPNTSTNNTDCDDSNLDLHPGAIELCNEIDDNCDNIVDNLTICPKPQNLVSSDISFDAATISWSGLSCPTGYEYKYREVLSGGGNAAWSDWLPTSVPSANLTGLNPGTSYQWTARAVCEFGPSTPGNLKVFTTCSLFVYYIDQDGDGFGEISDSLEACVNIIPPGFADNHLDCNDAAAGIYPGAPEYCDGIDNDCDNLIDGDEGLIFYLDADNDTYGDLNITAVGCTQPDGYVSSSSDCDDNSDISYPGATEECDAADNDCDGIIDNVSFCPKPTGVDILAVFMTSARINWDAVPCAVNDYQYRLRSKMNGVWSSFTSWIPVDTNYVLLTDLLPGTLYNYQVRSACYGINKYSIPSPSPLFSTLPGLALTGSIENAPASGVLDDIGNNKPFQVLTYPNPTSGQFSALINSSRNNIPAEIRLKDGFGRILEQHQEILFSGENIFEMNLSNYPEAIYYLELQMETGIAHYPIIKTSEK